MKKDFDGWNTQKKYLHKTGGVPLFIEGEIWWCALGVNIGYEEDGKNDQFERPVLVLKKFNRHVAWVIPLTTQVHADIFHYKLQATGAFVILSQLKLISSKRFLRRVKRVSYTEHLYVFERVKSLLTPRRISTKNDSRPFGAGSPVPDGNS